MSKFIDAVNDLSSRQELLGILSKEDTISLSTAIDTYTRINKERSGLVSKCYGNKKMQQKFDELGGTIKNIRLRMDQMIENYIQKN